MRTPFLLLVAALLGQAETPYRYFLSGSAEDFKGSPSAGWLLAGGGKDQDDAFRWFLAKAGGGDVVVLRASGADGYNGYMKNLAPLDSVESLVVASPEAALHPFVAERVRKAEALFIAGGDQWNYVRLWNRSPVGDALRDLVRRGVPMGGTSAGLAVLGEFLFTAGNDTVTSAQALADPFHQKVTVGTGFLQIPLLKGVVTDTHFKARDRMGRTLAFLARMLHDSKLAEARAIAVDERTAGLLEPDGRMTVAGEGSVYLLSVRQGSQRIAPGRPLELNGVSVRRLARGDSFNLRDWKGEGGAVYSLSVEAGAIRSTRSGGSVY